MKTALRFIRKHVAALSLVAVIIGALLAIAFDRWLEGLGTFLAAGTSPAFASTPANNFTPQTLTAANTALDGTGTTALIATAPATAGGGSLIDRVRCMHLGTNSSATVVRVFLNNGSTPTVAGNNALIAEKTMPANTVSQVAESAAVDIFLGVVLKANASTPERLYVSIGTAAPAGIRFTAIGGDL